MRRIPSLSFVQRPTTAPPAADRVQQEPAYSVPAMTQQVRQRNHEGEGRGGMRRGGGEVGGGGTYRDLGFPTMSAGMARCTWFSTIQAAVHIVMDDNLIN